MTDVFGVFGILDFNFFWEEVDKFNKQLAGILNYANQTVFFMFLFLACMIGAIVGIICLPRILLRHDKERRDGVRALSELSIYGPTVQRAQHL